MKKDKLIDVPEKTIAMIPVTPSDGVQPFDMKDVGLFLNPANTSHKREWFTPLFYKCLPLSIGNMQGFIFKSPFDFSVFWNGGLDKEDVKIFFDYETQKKYFNKNFVSVSSEFGSGIITVHFPLILKTPKGVNLMTIAPPNYPLPALSPLTGVVETDNLRFTFTINIKIDIPNVQINILKDTPLMGLLPVPRYFCDQFELVDGSKIIDKDLIKEEKLIARKNGDFRTERNKSNKKTYEPDGFYFSGKDFYENSFEEHQLPKPNKK